MHDDGFTSCYENPQKGRRANVDISPVTTLTDGYQSQTFTVTTAWDPTKTIAAKGFESAV